MNFFTSSAPFNGMRNTFLCPSFSVFVCVSLCFSFTRIIVCCVRSANRYRSRLLQVKQGENVELMVQFSVACFNAYQPIYFGVQLTEEISCFASLLNAF
eukprot:g3400.t1